MRNPNFLAKREEPKFADGRDATDAAFKKIHASGPLTRAELFAKRDDDEGVKLIALTTEERRAYLASTPAAPIAVEEIKKINAAPPLPFDPDEMRKALPVVERVTDRTVKAIHKAHGAAGARKVNINKLNAMLAREKANKLRKTFGLSKVGFPPQSSNGQWGGALADDGATDNYAPQPAPGTQPPQFRPRHATSMRDGRPPAQDSDGDPTVAALKAIFKAGPKRGL